MCRSWHRRAPASAGPQEPADRFQVKDRQAHGVLGRGQAPRGKGYCCSQGCYDISCGRGGRGLPTFFRSKPRTKLVSLFVVGIRCSLPVSIFGSTYIGCRFTQACLPFLSFFLLSPFTSRYVLPRSPRGIVGTRHHRHGFGRSTPSFPLLLADGTFLPAPATCYMLPARCVHCGRLRR